MLSKLLGTDYASLGLGEKQTQLELNSSLNKSISIPTYINEKILKGMEEGCKIGAKRHQEWLRKKSSAVE